MCNLEVGLDNGGHAGEVEGDAAVERRHVSLQGGTRAEGDQGDLVQAAQVGEKCQGQKWEEKGVSLPMPWPHLRFGAKPHGSLHGGRARWKCHGVGWRGGVEGLVQSVTMEDVFVDRYIANATELRKKGVIDLAVIPT